MEMVPFESASVVSAADLTSEIVESCGTGTVTEEFGDAIVAPDGSFADEPAVLRMLPASTSDWVTT